MNALQAARLEGFRRRLQGRGGANRVHFTPSQIQKIVNHFDGKLLNPSDCQLSSYVKHISLARPNFELKVDPADSARQFTFVISTQTIDRTGDTIAVDGWQLKNY